MKFKKLDQAGIALPAVIAVFMIVVIFGFVIMQMSLGDTRHASSQNNQIQAHYLGRSGIHHGIQMLEAKLSGDPYTGTTAELAAELQATVSDPYVVSDAGEYTIEFKEGTYSGQIEILSVGTTYGNMPRTDQVRYTKDLGIGADYVNPAGEWMTGVNLDKGINPSGPNKDYLGDAVLVESKNKHVIQSPKGSSNPSEFRASIMAFRDYDGSSLRQVTNSIDFTLNAEIILFMGDVELNKTNDDLFLEVSDEVLNHKTTTSAGFPGEILHYTDSTGFEDRGRYLEFINSSLDPAIDPWPADTFLAGENYGVVKFGGGVKDSDGVLLNVSDKGYYYFKAGMNLRGVDFAVANKELVKIDDSDPIVPILDSLTGLTYGTGEELWTN